MVVPAHKRPLVVSPLCWPSCGGEFLFLKGGGEEPCFLVSVYIKRYQKAQLSAGMYFHQCFCKPNLMPWLDWQVFAFLHCSKGERLLPLWDEGSQGRVDCIHKVCPPSQPFLPARGSHIRMAMRTDGTMRAHQPRPMTPQGGPISSSTPPPHDYLENEGNGEEAPL
jgi:hypothetical protein